MSFVLELFRRKDEDRQPSRERDDEEENGHDGNRTTETMTDGKTVRDATTTTRNVRPPDADSTNRYVMEFPPDWEGQDGDTTTETDSIRSRTRLQAVMRSFRAPSEGSHHGNMIVDFKGRSTAHVASRTLKFPRLKKDKERDYAHFPPGSPPLGRRDGISPITAPGDDNRDSHGNILRARETPEALQDRTSVNDMRQRLRLPSSFVVDISPQDTNPLTPPLYPKSDNLTPPRYPKAHGGRSRSSSLDSSSHLRSVNTPSLSPGAESMSMYTAMSRLNEIASTPHLTVGGARTAVGALIAKNEARERMNSYSSDDEELVAKISFMSSTFSRSNQESSFSILPSPIGNNRNNYDQGCDSSANQGSIALTGLESLLANRSESADGPTHSLLLEGGRSEFTPWDSNHNMLSHHQHLPTVSITSTPSLLPALPPKIWTVDNTPSNESNEHHLHDRNLLLGKPRPLLFDDHLVSERSSGGDIYDRSMEISSPSSSTCASDSPPNRYTLSCGGGGGGSPSSHDQQSHSSLSRAWVEYQSRRNQSYDHNENGEDHDNNTDHDSQIDFIQLETRPEDLYEFNPFSAPRIKGQGAERMSEVVVSNSDAMSYVSGLTYTTASTFDQRSSTLGVGTVCLSISDQEQQLPPHSDRHANLDHCPSNDFSQYGNHSSVSGDSVSGKELLRIKHQNQRKAKELLLRSFVHRLQDNPSLLHNVVSLSGVNAATKKNEVTPSTTEELKREGLIVGYSRRDHDKLLTNLDSILKELSKREDDGDVVNSIRFLSTVVMTAFDKSSLSPRGNYDVEGCTRHTKWVPKSWLNAAISAVPATPHYHQFDSPSIVDPFSIFSFPSSPVTPNTSNLSVNLNFSSPNTVNTWKDDDQQQPGRNGNDSNPRITFEIIVTLLQRMTLATGQLLHTEHLNPDAILATEEIKRVYLQLVTLNVGDVRDLCDGFDEDGHSHAMNHSGAARGSDVGRLSRERAEFRRCTEVLREVIEEVSFSDSYASRSSPVSASQRPIARDGKSKEEIDKERARGALYQNRKLRGNVPPSGHDLNVSFDWNAFSAGEDVETLMTPRHMTTSQCENYAGASGRTLTSDVTMMSELTMESALKDEPVSQRELFRNRPGSETTNYAILKLAGKSSSYTVQANSVFEEDNSTSSWKYFSPPPKNRASMQLPMIGDGPSRDSKDICGCPSKSVHSNDLINKNYVEGVHELEHCMIDSCSGSMNFTPQSDASSTTS